MRGTRLSSMNWRAVSRARRSSPLSRLSKPMKSTPLKGKATMRVAPKGKSYRFGGGGRNRQALGENIASDDQPFSSKERLPGWFTKTPEIEDDDVEWK